MDCITSFQQYSCGLMQKADIPAVGRFLKRLANEENLIAAKAFSETYLSTAKAPDFLQNSGETPFILKEGKDVIGIGTVISAGKDIEFEGPTIVPSKRGNGLASLVYDARVQYVAQNTDTNLIKMHILDSNKPAARAALKEGFHRAGESSEFGPSASEYHLDITHTPEP